MLRPQTRAKQRWTFSPRSILVGDPLSQPIAESLELNCEAEPQSRTISSPIHPKFIRNSETSLKSMRTTIFRGLATP